MDLLAVPGRCLVPAAEAGCGVASRLFLKESSADPGVKVTLTGVGFTECNDVPEGVRNPPVKVRIHFVQGKGKVEVARVDANEKSEISAVVTIPQDALPGTASFVAEKQVFGSKPVTSSSFTVTGIDRSQKIHPDS